METLHHDVRDNLCAQLVFPWLSLTEFQAMCLCTLKSRRDPVLNEMTHHSSILLNSKGIMMFFSMVKWIYIPSLVYLSNFILSK